MYMDDAEEKRTIKIRGAMGVYAILDYWEPTIRMYKAKKPIENQDWKIVLQDCL